MTEPSDCSSVERFSRFWHGCRAGVRRVPARGSRRSGAVRDRTSPCLPRPFTDPGHPPSTSTRRARERRHRSTTPSACVVGTSMLLRLVAGVDRDHARVPPARSRRRRPRQRRAAAPPIRRPRRHSSIPAIAVDAWKQVRSPSDSVGEVGRRFPALRRGDASVGRRGRAGIPVAEGVARSTITGVP